MSNFLANLDLAISRPEKTIETLKDHRIFRVLVTIIAYLSVIVWFEIGVDSKRSPILDFFDPAKWNILFNGIEPGTGWYSILFIALACVYFTLAALIPGIIFFRSSKKQYSLIAGRSKAKKPTEKTKITNLKTIISELLTGNGIRMPLFYAIACVPMLILNLVPFSSSEGFIYSLLWILGGIFANFSIWQTTGKIAGNYYISFRKGVIVSFISTLIGLGIIWGLYFLGGFS